MRSLFLAVTLVACGGEPGCPTPADFCADADGDGFGVGAAVQACSAPAGHAALAGDCDDTDPAVFPGSTTREVPFDGVDADCDGIDACTDLDCDGRPDLVFAQTDDGRGDHAIDSVVYLGGEGGFSADRSWAVPPVGAMGVDAADVDGDGYIDLAFASVQDGTSRLIDSRVYFGDGTGFSMERSVALPTIGCADPTLADLDGDGWVDAIFANRFRGGDPNLDNYSNDSFVYWGGPEGYSPERRLALPTVGAARSRVADRDGDGHNELIFAHGVLEVLGVASRPVWWGGPDGWGEDFTDLGSAFAEASHILWGGVEGWTERTDLPTTAASECGVRDLDRDGDLDVVCASHCAPQGGGPEVSQVYWNDGGFDLARVTELPTLHAAGMTIVGG